MDIGSLLLLVLVTALALGMAMLAMAVGVILKRRRLRGSCGGAAVRDANGSAIACDDCPNRDRRGSSAPGHTGHLADQELRGMVCHAAAPGGGT